MTITKYWTIETNDYDDVLVEVIIPDPFATAAWLIDIVAVDDRANSVLT